MRGLAISLVFLDLGAAILFLSLASSATPDQPVRVLIGLATLCFLNALALVARLRA